MSSGLSPTTELLDVAKNTHCCTLNIKCFFFVFFYDCFFMNSRKDLDIVSILEYSQTGVSVGIMFLSYNNAAFLHALCMSIYMLIS